MAAVAEDTEILRKGNKGRHSSACPMTELPFPISSSQGNFYIKRCCRGPPAKGMEAITESSRIYAATSNWYLMAPPSIATIRTAGICKKVAFSRKQQGQGHPNQENLSL